MSSINPKLLFALVAAIAVVAFLKLGNPYRKYGTEEFWQSATVEDVNSIPDEALLPGNRNGGVLMWAAMASSDPAVLSALVNRGADINENDAVLNGTPLSAAAGFSSNPAIIDELIKLGADVNREVSGNRHALIVAALFNTNPGIIERLVFHGADVNKVDINGDTALDLAIMNKNTVAISALEKL